MKLPALWSLRCATAVVAALATFATISDGSAQEQPAPRLSFSDAIKRAMPSVVGIQVKGEEHIEESNAFYNHPAALAEGASAPKPRTRTVGSIGSGVIVGVKGDTGYIVTNFHVIEGADRIGIKMYDGRAFEAKLVGRDAPTDIALLSVEAPDLVPIRLGGRKPLAVGDLVLAIGAPLGPLVSR